MTFAEFRRPPEPPFGAYLELHRGEPVEIPLPRYRQVGARIRARQIVGPRVEGFGLAVEAFPFRALKEPEFRRADVAIVSHARLALIDEDDVLHSAPELVIEVLSPSNTRPVAKRAICFANGAWEY